MRFRLEWIASYLPGELPDDGELRSRLTAAGLIVEGVEGAGRDAVLDIEITANRPDCMNHRGVAREASVALGRPFAVPAAEGALPEEGVPASAYAHVVIEEPELCSRYSASILRDVVVRDSRGPVRERLAALDLSTISGPVDATNFALWDIGQPMHAFDLDKLAKGPDGRVWIVVRRARPGETLVTLDGVSRVLGSEHLVIADPEKAVALAGIMGGLETAISASTRNILLESAHFDATVVRRGARALGMHTDASHRFERGTDPETTVEGLAKVGRLVLADGGRAACGVLDVVARAVTRPTVRLRLAHVPRFLGMGVPEDRTRQVLQDLGFACRPAEGCPGELDVTVPSWRVDVDREVDLIEEVIRHVGYSTLPESLPPAHLPTHTDPRVEREDRARDVLSGAGLFEACTYSFVSAAENAPFETAAPGDRLLIGNPLGEPFEVLRATPLVGLLRVAQHNVRRGVPDVGVFEVGRAYGHRDGQPSESRRACLLLVGGAQPHWSGSPRSADFYDGSGLVAALFAGLGLPAPRLRPVELPFLSRGRAAEVLSTQGPVGWVGVLRGSLARLWDLTDPVVADLDLERIPALEPPKSVEAPSRFPGSDVDLTVSHRVGLPFGSLLDAVQGGAPPELRAVGVKYRYQGAGVPPGFVKTTLHLTFGSLERSLSREEVNAWRDEAALRILGIAETRVDGVSPVTAKS